MRTYRLIAFLCITTAALFLLSCRNPVVAGQTPIITGFVIKQADNPVLSADIQGLVNEQSKIIVVALPDSLVAADRANLKVQVSLGSDTILLGDTLRDFRQSPISFAVTNNDGDTSNYLVKVTKVYPNANPNALIFSEYYAGAGYTLKGSNNQYLELTNLSSGILDLSGYELYRSVWENGVRRADKDVRVSLSGTLDPGKALVIYSNRLSPTFTNIMALPINARQSDVGYNTIIAFSGQDGFRLLHNGQLMDVIGPNEGTGNGLYWGSLKSMLRKTGKKPGAIWNDADWITYAVTNSMVDAGNAGAVSLVIPNTNTNLTYFAFEGLPVRSYGVIDHTAKTVEISVHESQSKIISPTVSTDGLAVWYRGSPIVAGKTMIDFSGPVKIRVVAVGGTYVDYTVSFSTYRTIEYTTTNYNFDGGIAGVLAKITADPVIFSETFVEGIVTARDIYSHSTAQYSFFIQDKNAGLLFFTNNPLDASILVGQRIRVQVLEAKTYYGMPEITAHGSVTKVSSVIHDLYYETDAFNAAPCLGKVYCYTGLILKEMDSFSVGTLADGMYFHGTRALQSLLTQDSYGKIYGPITLSFDLYRMEISQSYQIKK